MVAICIYMMWLMVPTSSQMFKPNARTSFYAAKERWAGSMAYGLAYPYEKFNAMTAETILQGERAAGELLRSLQRAAAVYGNECCLLQV
jgi:hypothetical protein